MAGTLVVHPGALGDVLLAVPALRVLRHAHPDERLTLAAQPRIAGLLRDLGVIDDAIGVDSLGLDALFTGDPLPDRVRIITEADRVVCWFGANDSGFVRRLSGIAREVVIGLPAAKDRDVWQHLVGTLGPRHVTHREPVTVPPALIDEGRRALVASGWDDARPLMMIHPGAGGVAKRWSVEGFADVIARFGGTRSLAIVVHEGPADREAVRALRARLAPSMLWLDNPSLSALAGALAQATIYLGNDSGISHLAAAVGARGVVLFTTGALPWRPWSPTVECLVVSTMSLYPQDVDTVAAALERSWTAH